MSFMLSRESMTLEVLIRFYAAPDQGRRKVFLVLDNLRVHHSKVVQAWLEEDREQIEGFFLPSDSPELNSDEFMNGDLRMKISTSELTRGGDHLKKKVVSHPRSIQGQPHRVRSYFKAKAGSICRLNDVRYLTVGATV